MAAQAGLCLARSETPEDTFCRVVTHLISFQSKQLLSFYVVCQLCIDKDINPHYKPETVVFSALISYKRYPKPVIMLLLSKWNSWNIYRKEQYLKVSFICQIIYFLSIRIVQLFFLFIYLLFYFFVFSFDRACRLPPNYTNGTQWIINDNLPLFKLKKRTITATNYWPCSTTHLPLTRMRNRYQYRI